jgi:hypothetical protein
MSVSKGLVIPAIFWRESTPRRGCPPEDCGHDDTHLVETAKPIAAVIPAIFRRESIRLVSIPTPWMPA